MDVFAGPALLGGIMVGMILGSRSPERSRRGADPAADPVLGDAAGLRCDQSALGERGTLPDTAMSLTALHDEIRTYRLAQRRLIAAGHDMPGVPLPPPTHPSDCRYLGIRAEAGGVPVSQEQPGFGCGGGDEAGPPDAAPGPNQPSLPASAPTRV